MRHRLVRRAAALTAALLLGGCADFLQQPTTSAPPAIDHKAASSQALADDFALIGQLMTSSPEQQMEITGTAEEDFQGTPSASRKLRLALILGVPDQAASDLPRARQMLSELASEPDSSLLPGERSLVALQLKQIGDYLTLEKESRTLAADAARTEQIAALKRRLDGAAGENVKLRKQLQEARAKLAAIANIEKSLNERKPGRPK